MKKFIVTLFLALLMGAGAFVPQVQARSTFSLIQTKHLKKDGTPDKRYKDNKHLKKNGTPDMRYKDNKKKKSKM
jgi:hypothetical protein